MTDKTTVTPFNVLDYLTTSAMIDAYRDSPGTQVLVFDPKPFYDPHGDPPEQLKILENIWNRATFQHIDDYVKAYNVRAEPFVWTKKKSVNAASKTAVSLSYDSGY